MTMPPRLLPAALLALALVWPGHAVWACSCWPPSMADAFRDSDLIARGTVQTIVAGDPSRGWSGYSLVVLSPEKFWKDEKELKSILVLNPDNDGTCRFPFELGHSYLVYATWNDFHGAYVTNMCTRTTQIYEGLADIPFLDTVVSIESSTWSNIKRLYSDANP